MWSGLCWVYSTLSFTFILHEQQRLQDKYAVFIDNLHQQEAILTFKDQKQTQLFNFYRGNIYAIQIVLKLILEAGKWHLSVSPSGGISQESFKSRDSLDSCSA